MRPTGRTSKRVFPHQTSLCTECPWRTDTTPGQFSADRYEALAATHGAPGAEAPIGAPLFACHKTVEGSDAACAGFLAVEGHNHLTVRLAVIEGHLPPEALSPRPGWPELFATFDDMAQAQGR